MRVIDTFVNGLDLKELGINRATRNETDRPPYDPHDLLKLYVFGYFNRIRSSRRLKTKFARNVKLFYLLGKFEEDNQ